jgi:parvulin-like peptidyl-prolyl isomerase
LRRLSALAEKDKLQDLSPVKEILEFQRMMTLSQMQLSANLNAMVVEGSDIVKEYQSRKEKYKQVKVKVIYISFLSEALLKSATKGLSEEQAKAKADKLVAEIRKGADFVQLVKANSDDKDSREKDGDFQPMRRSDNLPEAIRDAVFALEKGAVSDPVKVPNGYYIFKAEEVGYRPQSEVRDEIYNDLKLEMHQRWMKATDASVKVKIVKEDFFKPQAAPAAPAK